MWKDKQNLYRVSSGFTGHKRAKQVEVSIGEWEKNTMNKRLFATPGRQQTETELCREKGGIMGSWERGAKTG